MTRRALPKYILCRPRGGLNDTLCAIGYCLKYAKDTGRFLIIDSLQSGIGDFFWNYFEWKEFGLRPIYASTDMLALLDRGSVFPEILNGRLSNFQADYSFRRGCYCEVESGLEVPVLFDGNTHYDEDVIVYEQGWLGQHFLSPYTLAHVRLNPVLNRIVSSRLDGLPDSYVSIHIRNTDYESDYKSFLSSIIDGVKGRNVFVCSDNSEVLNYCRNFFPPKLLHRLSRFDNFSMNPLHSRVEGKVSLNIDTLTDLIAAASGEEVYFPNVTHRGQELGRPSGFSLLMKALNANKPILNEILWLT